MQYSEFQYLFPPRPDQKVPPASCGFMDKLGYVAQKKKNGTCTPIFTCGKELIFKTRHPELEDGNHRAWAPNDSHKKFFSKLGGKWNVFVAELLHNKGPTIKNELFIFDILVRDGEYLVGKSFMERQHLLVDLWGKTWVDEGDQYRVHEHVTVAKIIKTDFKKIFANLGPQDEGLVFKLPKSKLELCSKATANNSWQQKCRAPQTNFSF